MNIDLSNLTVAGKTLVGVTIVVAAISVLTPFVLALSNGTRITGGAASRAIGIPIAIVVGAAVFGVGRLLMSALKISLTKDQEPIPKL